MLIEFLGTRGEAEKKSDKHKEHSSLLVEYKKKQLLIDWGESHEDEKLPDVDWVLITHSHSENITKKSAMKLVHKKVFMNKSTAEVLKDIPFEDIEILKDEETKTFDLGSSFRITAFPVMHSVRAPTTCYKIEGDNTIVYCPNVLWIRKRTGLFKKVDIYVGDGSNISRSVVRRKDRESFGSASILAQLKWCQIEGIEKAIFTHFGEGVIELGELKTLELLGKKFSNGVAFGLADDGFKLNTKAFMRLGESGSRFEFCKDKSGEWRWRFRDSDNGILAVSEKFHACSSFFELQKITFISECPKCGFIFSSDINPEEKELKCPKCGGICKIFRGDHPPENIPYLDNSEKGGLISKKLLHDLCLIHRGDQLRHSFIKEAEGSLEGAEDAVKLLHKESSFRLAQVKDGIYIVELHARMIAEGKKKALVKSIKFETHLGEPLYLLGGNNCYGIIQYDEIREIDLKEFKNLQDIHRVSDAERLKFFKDKKSLFYYPIKVIELYKPPKKFKRPWGSQTFITDIKFLEKETSPLDKFKGNLLTEEEKEYRMKELKRLIEKPDPKKDVPVDKEMIPFLTRINQFPFIMTTQSCCGHREKPEGRDAHIDFRSMLSEKETIDKIIRPFLNKNGISVSLMTESDRLRYVLWLHIDTWEEELENLISILKGIEEKSAGNIEKQDNWIYYAKCTSCGYTFESEIDPDEHDVKCPKCGGKCKVDTMPRTVPLHILVIEETKNEVWARIQNPKKYDSDSFRRKPFPPSKPEKGVFAIYACPKGEFKAGRCQVGMQIQSMRFTKKAGWTIEKARAWIKRHKLEAENILDIEDIGVQEIKERIKLTKLKQKLAKKMLGDEDK